MAVDMSEIVQEVEQEGPSAAATNVTDAAVAEIGPEPEPGPESTVAQEFNLGIAQMLGLPGDVFAGINRAATQITGIDFGDEVPFIPTSRDLQQGLSRPGITPAPGEERQDVAGRAARFVGGGALPTGGVLFAGGRLLRGSQAGRRTAQQAGQRVGREATRRTGAVAQAGRRAAAETARRPGTALAGETAAAGGAAAGGVVGEEAFPDNAEVARALGELIGGLGVAAGPAMAVEGARRLPLPRVVRALGENAAESFSSGRRARGRVEQMSDDPARAADDIAAGEGPPMERTDEAGLLQLERTVMERNPEIGRRILEQRRGAREGLESQARMGGAREDARSFIEKRTMTAIRDLERRVSRLRPGSEPDQAATAAREELDRALGDVRRRENALWNEVPGDSTLVPTSARQEMEDVLQTENAPERLPGFLRKKIGDVVEDDSGEVSFQAGSLGDDATLEQIKTTRSQVLQTIRAEQRAGETDFNRIRMLRRLDEALLDDMERAGGEAVNKALAISREKNRIFRGGALGKVLKFTNRIEPEQTLEATLGISGRGQTQAVNFRQMMEGAQQAGDPQTAQRLQSQVEEFLKDAFVVQAVDPDSGQISTQSAQRFLNNRRSLLKEFPQLDKQLRNARSRQKMVNERLGTVSEQITPLQRQKAATALFIDGQPGTEMDSLLRVGDPESALKTLVRETRQDRSGRAFRGLKATFAETLMERARSGGTGETGERFVQGSKFLEELSRLGPAAQRAGVLSESEANRLRLIGEKFRRFENAETSRGAGGITDTEGLVGNMLSRSVQILGAVGGRQLNTGTIQAPGFGASIAQRIKQSLTRDQAEELLVRFVQEPKLARTLLMDLDAADPKQMRELRRRLGPTIGAGTPAAEDRDARVTGE